MARYLNTRGRSTLGIGICDRCQRKFPLADLRRDGNQFGMRVCIEDWDERDPDFAAPMRPDRITLPFYRPDVSIAIAPADVEDVLPPDDQPALPEYVPGSTFIFLGF